MQTKRLIGITIAVLFSIAMLSNLTYAQVKYPFKSAIVKYKVSGSTQNGEQQLYVDDYGKKTCMIMNVTGTISGFTHTTNMMNITSGNDIYTIDLAAKTGTKVTMTPQQREKIMNMAKQMMPTPEEMAKNWNKVGTEKVLGKPCDIYEGQGIKAWIWKNLILKQEVTLMGEYHMEAVSLDVDANIPADQFEPPPGVTITEQKLPAEMPVGSPFGQE